jgi:flavin-dependent dehydrogenase
VRPDVIVAGAGPAGSLAALILARAGLHVDMFDRAAFPRPKLCGDTLNPGALRVLEQYMPIAPIVERSLPLDGMILTGPGTVVRGAYGTGTHGHAIVRRELDMLLVRTAVEAGVHFHERTLVAAPVVNGAGEVAGVVIQHDDGRRTQQPCKVVIAADGRESRLARSAALTHHPVRPRRWAIGGYFSDAEVDARYGEMHVRRGHYIGVAPVCGGLANVCLVVPHSRGDGGWRDPSAMLMRAVRRDPRLAARFAGATLVDGPHVLGPMALDARACGVPGMLLAGDAAGFIDPITGDGLRLALQGAALAADVTLEVLTGRCAKEQAAHVLAARRQAAFARKWRFNRVIRTVVATPGAVTGAALAARMWPAAFRAVIRFAGDVEAG